MRLGSRNHEAPPEDTKMYHSRMYHRHFEGYRETVETNAKGKKRIHRVYTASYYHCDLADSAKILLRLLYLALSVLAVALTLNNGISDAEVNLVWYTALPQAILIPVFVWAAYTLFYYMFTFHDMTIGDYRTCSKGLQKSFFMLFLVYCSWFVTSVLFFIIHHASASLSSSVVYLTKIIISAAACFLVYAMENRIPYSKTENPVSASGVEIH